MQNKKPRRPRHLICLLLLGLWGMPALATAETSIPADLQTAISQSRNAYEIQQKLTAQTNESDDAQKSAEFGFRIALSADGNTALVGAGGTEVAGLQSAGAVYVYTRTSTGWTIQQKLTAQNSDGSDDVQEYAVFANSVALSADGLTAVIGADNVAVSAHAFAGAAYVYRRNGSLWQIQQKITAQKTDGTPDASANAAFGSAVALSGDGHTAAIGARQALGEGVLTQSDPGAVYVYRSTDTGWQIQQKVMAQNTDGTSDATPGAGFGDAVALAEDGGTLLAGADLAGDFAGAGYVYSATDSGWIIQQKLTAQTSRGKDDSEPGARFGGAVVLSADGRTALIAAFQASVSGLQHAGAAYVYQRKGARWSIQQKLIAQSLNGKSDAAAEAWFGACALTGDGDTALIGAPYADADGLSHAGAAYLYHRAGKRWNIQQKLTAKTESGTSDAEANAHFGKTALSANGGIAFIGAYDATVSSLSNAGAVYAYDSAYRLTVTANAGGMVTSDPVGIDCGATCEAKFAKGSVVTLTAIPAEGYRFKGWSGSGCSGKKPCTVKLNKSKTVKAMFAPFPGLAQGWVVGTAPVDGYGVILHTASGGLRWDRQGSTGDVPSVRLNNVKAVSREVAWVVGNHDSGYGVILQSRDGGQTWGRQGQTDTIPDVNLFGVGASDLKNAWVVGGQGTILRTRDGGKTWATQASGTTVDLYEVAVVNSKVAWIVGNEEDGYAVVLHTDDGGRTWERQGTAATLNAHIFIDVAAATRWTAWAVGTDSTVSKTTDGGKTWEVQMGHGLSHNNGVAAVDSETAWIAADYNVAYRTTDGGADWARQRINVPGNYYLLGVSAATQDTAWMVGMGIGVEAGHGIILQTTDGGATWQIQTPPVDAPFRRVSFVGAR
ncbi:MAG: YCF48-related protein [Methylococcus sp.]|nr:YCF48-related protein [Methylococcus sp.]